MNKYSKLLKKTWSHTHLKKDSNLRKMLVSKKLANK